MRRSLGLKTTLQDKVIESNDLDVIWTWDC